MPTLDTCEPQTTPEPARSGPALADKARQAVAWTAGITIFQDLLQLAITLNLTRLLPPDAYGKFSFVNTTIGFFTVFSFREIVNYTLLVRSDEETNYQDQFTAGVFIQGALFLLVNLMAFGIRSLPAYAPAAYALHIMSLLLPLDLISEFRVKMIERQMDWKRLRTLHAVGLTLGAVLALSMAFAGGGVYSLLVPSLMMPIPFAYDLFVREGWRPTWELRRERYLPAFRFGITRIGSGGAVTISSFIESAVLTRAIGFVQLGIYNRALGLSVLVCQRVAALFVNALYPVLARVTIQSDQYRRVSALILRCMAWAVIPLAVGIGLTAEPVIRLLYGTQWLDAVHLVPPALAIGALISLVHVTYVLLLAHQRQQYCLAADLVRLSGTVLALVFALGHGLETYMLALIAMHTVILLATLSWLYRDRAMRWTGVQAAFTPALVGAAAAFASVAMLQWLTGMTIGPIWTGFAAGALFMTVYLTSLRVVFPASLRELVCQLPRSATLLSLLRLPAA
ncbi:MAG: oligosaccharide flippase family protein [Acidobacteriaceae bacterium]|jgi:O-antigen/teichoic acid export membrane protein|nr:oligosaccharide flippase family protein [Acidobacteriaceae bacterium]